MRTIERSSGTETHPSAQNEHPNGVILYQGPSQLNREPIVAILTGLTRPSANSKTGWSMLQTWILPATETPLQAIRTGKDESVCGRCPLRGAHARDRACYVNLGRAPTAVWQAWTRQLYPTVDEKRWKRIRGRPVRLGSYGDPAAVPSQIWFRLAGYATGWTGYTHHWRDPRLQHLRWLLMASVDTPHEAWEAQALGWRTYRTRLESEELLPFESTCPASKEAGHKTTCERCLQCNGTQAVDVRRSYAIEAHGVGRKAYERLRTIDQAELEGEVQP
jgi:hypothetical protein